MSQSPGARCTRCGGTGWVNAEEEGLPVDKDGWLSMCPYFDVKAGVECHNGTIRRIPPATDNAPETSNFADTPKPQTVVG